MEGDERWVDGNAFGWAVWSAWRADLALLAHTVRVMQRAVAATSTVIEVAVRDDVEPFTSSKDLLENVTPRAAAEPDAIRVRVEGAAASAELRIARRSGPAHGLPFVPGVVLQVAAASEDDMKEARTRIAAAVTRGGMSFSSDPAESSQADESWTARLEKAVKDRATVLALVILMLTTTGAAIEAVGLLLGNEGVRAFSVVPTLLFLPFVVVGFVVSEKPATLHRRWVNTLYSFPFPAVEVASITPGRRRARTAVRVLAPVALAILGVLIE